MGTPKRYGCSRVRLEQVLAAHGLKLLLCAISTSWATLALSEHHEPALFPNNFLNCLACAERTLSVTLTSLPITTLVESFSAFNRDCCQPRSALEYPRRTWLLQLDCGTLMLQFPLQLRSVMTTFSFRAYHDFVGNPRASLLTDGPFRPQMLPTTVRVALAEVDPRLG